MEARVYTEHELAAPECEPNPQLSALMNLRNDLYRLGMDTLDLQIRGEFMSAYNFVTYAVERVIKAKNVMAGGR